MEETLEEKDWFLIPICWPPHKNVVYAVRYLTKPKFKNHGSRSHSFMLVRFYTGALTEIWVKNRNHHYRVKKTLRKDQIPSNLIGAYFSIKIPSNLGYWISYKGESLPPAYTLVQPLMEHLSSRFTYCCHHLVPPPPTPASCPSTTSMKPISNHFFIDNDISLCGLLAPTLSVIPFSSPWPSRFFFLIMLMMLFYLEKNHYFP